MSIAAFISQDSGLAPYKRVLAARLNYYRQLEASLRGEHQHLKDCADWHEFYGLHHFEGGWRFREWLPNATAVFLVGDFSDWRCEKAFELKSIGFGNWEGTFPEKALQEGEQYRMKVFWNGGEGDRLPSAVCRVGRSSQDISRSDVSFNAVVTMPLHYKWRYKRPTFPENALIYEAHIGMAQEKYGIGTFEEFRTRILPRIAAGGYNVLQLMAIAQHPYYASFGYHVSNFFSVYDQYGTNEEFCRLVDEAHGMGICVIMDLVHSHSASNTMEGLSCLDGTSWQFFHDGARGEHPAWGSRCFDYAKREVIRFLLSNCRFWLEEYHLDGYRFDGITSMLYRDHGLGTGNWCYADYFGGNVDGDALAYLALANRVIRQVYPGAFTIAEDVSGFPGLCMPQLSCGAGFSCRLAMGVTDFWFKLTDIQDEFWPLGTLWYELNGHRPEEHTISYVESHDQALVGGQTFAFSLLGNRMYNTMACGEQSLEADRMIALHKMARLVTLATANRGYLNFMGNEFGHPEWIDFPGAHNGWTFDHARRQWSLADDLRLKFHYLYEFDKAMLKVAGQVVSSVSPMLILLDEEKKLLCFERAGQLFLFNFHPEASYSDLEVASFPGAYELQLSTDDVQFGGYNRIAMPQMFWTQSRIDGNTRKHFLQVYLPARTAIVLKRKGEIR